MILEQTRLVTRENGPNPDEGPHECFYCHETVGNLHKTCCVCFQKIVMVETTWKYPCLVPAKWEERDIESYLNARDWDGDTLTRELAAYFTSCRKIPNTPCHVLETRYLGDVTGIEMEGLETADLIMPMKFCPI